MRHRSMLLLAAVLAAGTLLHLSPLLAGQAAAPHGGGHGGSMHGQHMGELDINRASVEELRQLPGIGEATARKIAQNRPYARKDELVTKKVLPQAAYDAIREHIVAAPAAGAKPGGK